MRGIGEPQRQIGEDGLGVSGAPEALPIRIGPIVMGKRHSQHTSEIGLTKRPVQVCADAGAAHSTADSASTASGKARRLMRLRLPRLPRTPIRGTPIRGPVPRHRRSRRSPYPRPHRPTPRRARTDPDRAAARTGC